MKTIESAPAAVLLRSLNDLDRFAQAVTGRRRESHSGLAREAHDERAAERRLKLGLKALGLSEGESERLPRGAAEKVALAWWLRERTTAPLRWVSERLRMGRYTRVTQALSRMRRRPAGNWRGMRKKLNAL